jgi:hypothetical protein
VVFETHPRLERRLRILVWRTTPIYG